MDYTGYKKIQLNDEEMAKFYSGEYPIDVVNNQYLLISDTEGNVVDKYYLHKGELERVMWKPLKSQWLGTVKPLNLTQELGFHMLQTADSTLKVFNSSYGVGKSYLCASYLLYGLEKGLFDKAILIRPNIGLEDYPSLGLVPGDFDQKAIVWFAMLGDIMGGMEGVRMLIEEGKLELAPLETLRGRSFNKSIILVEECGNLTTAACRLIVSRCGRDSVLLMCGDESQADKKKFREDSGLRHMSEALIGNPLFSYLRLEGCVRSETAQLCELF